MSISERPAPGSPEYDEMVRAEYASLSAAKLRAKIHHLERTIIRGCRSGFLQRTIDGLDCRLGVAVKMLRERERQ